MHLVFLFVIMYVVFPIFGFKTIDQTDDLVEAINTFEKYPLFHHVISQYLAIFVAMFYIVLTMALRERMHPKVPTLMNFTVVAAIIAAIGTFYGSMVNNSLMEAIVQTKDCVNIDGHARNVD